MIVSLNGILFSCTFLFSSLVTFVFSSFSSLIKFSLSLFQFECLFKFSSYLLFNLNIIYLNSVCSLSLLGLLESKRKSNFKRRKENRKFKKKKKKKFRKEEIKKGRKKEEEVQMIVESGLESFGGQ